MIRTLLCGMKSVIAVTVIAVATTLRAGAQEQDVPAHDRVRIESLPPGAEVWHGDSLLGVTPRTVARSLISDIEVWYPSRSEWSAQRDTIAATAPSAQEGVVLMQFRIRIPVASVPYGAAVFEGDSLLGYTPVLVDVTGGERQLRIERPGHVASAVRVGEATVAPVVVVLETTGEGAATPQVREQTSFFHLPSLSVSMPAGVGLMAGIAAVVFKQEADASYDRYRATADAALLDRARRYDVYAGIALGLSELALAWLVWQLFSSH